MRDLRQTPEYANYMRSIGWSIEKLGKDFAYIRKFPLIGSFIKIQRPRQFNNTTTEVLSKKYRAFQIIIEPSNKNHELSIKISGFKQMRSYFIPPKTIHIDLTKSEKKLLQEMHYKTRYNIKKAGDYNLKLTISKDISAFASFWQECARKQRGMFLSQKREIVEIYKAFKDNAKIVTVKKDTYTLASILLIFADDTAYYMYAASTQLGKKLFAPTLAVWEAIKVAKKLKRGVFDFEGIYDDRFPIKSWKGFTRFKKSFGGKTITYPGAFTKYRVPF